MRKRILLVLGAVFLAGALFYLSGSLWSGSFSLPGVEEGKGQSAGTEWGASQNVPEASSAGQEQHTGNDWKESQVSPGVASAEGWTEYNAALEAFESMDIQVTAANVHVELGDQYQLRYSLPPEEEVKRAEIQSGVLYFKTDIPSGRSSVSTGSIDTGEVWITVPAQSRMNHLAFSCVSGDVAVPEFSCSSLSVEVVSGNLEIGCTVDGTAEFQVISGGIRFTGSCQEFESSQTSGDLDFLGSAEKLTASTVSGDVTAEGACGEMQVEAASGDIYVKAADPSVTATGREIVIDGEAVGREKFVREGSGSVLNLMNLSGEISIDTY